MTRTAAKPPAKPDLFQVVVYLLAKAGSRLRQDFEFTPKELHAAMKKLKDSISSKAKASGILDDLYFSQHTITPYSSTLEQIIGSLSAGGINLLPTLSIGGGGERYSFRSSWLFDKIRICTRLSPDEIALVNPLVPRFVKYLKFIVSHRDDPKP
jgi:hypothetical protein